MGGGGREIGTGELSTGSRTGITLFSWMTIPLVFELILARIVGLKELRRYFESTALVGFGRAYALIEKQVYTGRLSYSKYSSIIVTTIRTMYDSSFVNTRLCSSIGL